MGRDWDFARGFVAKARPLHLHAAIGQSDGATLLAMPTDIARALPGRSRPSHLLGAQRQNCFDGLPANLVDHGVHHLAGTLDGLHQRQQLLPVGFQDFLDDLGRGWFAPARDVVLFLHGG